MMQNTRHSTKIPENMQLHYNSITELIDAFCQEKLNKKYEQLAHYATAALCRKKPSPLLSGHAKAWACAILYALGTINFLFDKSQIPFITGAELALAFGVSQSNAGSKAKQVRQLLSMKRFDHRWCLPSRLDNSLNWMIAFNGFIVDARTLPREIQEIAYKKGLIPYLPENYS